ncbi:MAG: toxic anion resistance protein, partial [Oscillospiraceae bacterium]
MSEAKMPELVLPTEENFVPEKQELAAEKAQSSLDINSLTEAERNMVLDFASKIDISDSTILVQFGAPA